MKTIILFRHGKSDWNADYGQDHERPLAPRGIKAAGAMGKWLRDTGQIPDHHVSSSAVRARTTLQLAKEAGAWGGETHIVPALYESSVADYIEVARQTPDTADSVILTGHEPTSSGTTRALSGGAIVRFPTATMARIDVDIASWKELGRYPGQLIWFMPPKFLG
ncbi:MAG: histidine phosphatase family protein [Bacteroidota bacterium]